MPDRIAVATMQVAVPDLGQTSVVLMPGVPMTVVPMTVALMTVALRIVAMPVLALMTAVPMPDVRHLKDAVLMLVADLTRAAMLDRDKVAIKGRTPVVMPVPNVVPKSVVPKSVVLTIEAAMRDVVLHLKVADPIKVAARTRAVMLDRDKVAIDAPMQVAINAEAPKALSRDDRRLKACVRPSMRWTETMMAKSAATKS